MLGLQYKCPDVIRAHYGMLIKGKHYASNLQKAWFKYGIVAFIFGIVEFCQKEQLRKREQFWMNRLFAFSFGFNTYPNAESPLGNIRPEDVCRKISIAHKGKKLSEETKAKMSKAQKGNKNAAGYRHTLEAKAKISAASRGRKMSEEAKAKISAANKGRKVSEEARKKIGRANRGRKHTPEACRKMSIGRKGIRPSLLSIELARKRIIEYNKSRKNSKNSRMG